MKMNKQNAIVNLRIRNMSWLQQKEYFEFEYGHEVKDNYVNKQANVNKTFSPKGKNRGVSTWKAKNQKE